MNITNRDQGEMPGEMPDEIGYLRVKVSTAQGAVPLSDAIVTVRNNKSDGNRDVIYSTTTNADGLTEKIALATVPRSASEGPDRGVPFLTYNLEVALPGYYTQYYQNVPVFAGISALQSVEMIPLPQNGYDFSLSPDDERFFEGENPLL